MKLLFLQKKRDDGLDRIHEEVSGRGVLQNTFQGLAGCASQEVSALPRDGVLLEKRQGSV